MASCVLPLGAPNQLVSSNSGSFRFSRNQAPPGPKLKFTVRPLCIPSLQVARSSNSIQQDGKAPDPLEVLYAERGAFSDEDSCPLFRVISL